MIVEEYFDWLIILPSCFSQHFHEGFFELALYTSN
jgi:hypothetical protein